MDASVTPLRHGGLSLVQTTDFFYPLVDDPYMMVCRWKVLKNGKINQIPVEFYCMCIIDLAKIILNKKNVFKFTIQFLKNQPNKQFYILIVFFFYYFDREIEIKKPLLKVSVNMNQRFSLSIVICL